MIVEPCLPGNHGRDGHRGHIAGVLLKRMAAAGKKTFTEEQLSSTADVLSVLAGFATYDALARAGLGQEEIITIVTRLAHFAVS